MQAKVEAKAAEIGRQQRELRTLKEKGVLWHDELMVPFLLGGQRKAAGRGGG